MRAYGQELGYDGVSWKGCMFWLANVMSGVDYAPLHRAVFLCAVDVIPEGVVISDDLCFINLCFYGRDGCQKIPGLRRVQNREPIPSMIYSPVGNVYICLVSMCVRVVLWEY